MEIDLIINMSFSTSSEDYLYDGDIEIYRLLVFTTEDIQESFKGYSFSVFIGVDEFLSMDTFYERIKLYQCSSMSYSNIDINRTDENKMKIQHTSGRRTKLLVYGIK